MSKKYVITLALFGLLSVFLRGLNHLLPFFFFGLGVVMFLLGHKLKEYDKTVGVWELQILGLLALTASLTQVWLDGNVWLLIAPAIVSVFAGVCIQQFDSDEHHQIMWREMGQAIVALLLPTLGLIALRLRSETGAELALVALLYVGLTTLIGVQVMPRYFVRIARRLEVIV